MYLAQREPKARQSIRIDEHFILLRQATQRIDIREAWDGKRLGSLTKHDAVSATGVHVSVIGHITKDELMAELTT